MSKPKFERTKPHVNVGRSGMWTTEDDVDLGDHQDLAMKGMRIIWRLIRSIKRRRRRSGD